MTNILLVTSSPRGGASYSNRVAARLVEELHRVHAGARLVVRDLAKTPLRHIDEQFAAGRSASTDEAPPDRRHSLALSDVLIDELLAADIVVIAVAMINFGIPSPLKAWIDHIARPRRTFQYGESGPQGLVTGKQVILVEAKGGIYSEGPRREFDHVTPYMLQLLAFLGMEDVKVISVEGTSLGAEVADAALGNGFQQAVEIARELASNTEAPLVPAAQDEGGPHALVSF